MRMANGISGPFVEMCARMLAFHAIQLPRQVTHQRSGKAGAAACIENIQLWVGRMVAQHPRNQFVAAIGAVAVPRA